MKSCSIVNAIDKNSPGELISSSVISASLPSAVMETLGSRFRTASDTKAEGPDLIQSASTCGT